MGGTKRRKRMGRPKLAPGEKKDENLSFRVRPDVYAALLSAAKRAGHGINSEARDRVEESVQIDAESGGSLRLVDTLRLARYARLVSRLTAEAGGDPEHWADYAYELPLMMSDVNNPANIERARVLVRKAVDAELEEAARLDERYGTPPASEEPSPRGLHADERLELMLRQGNHRLLARRRDQILRNRAAIARARIEEIEANPHYRDSNTPEHREIAIEMARLREVISQAESLNGDET